MKGLKYKPTLFGKIIFLSSILEFIMLVIVVLALYTFQLNEKQQSLSYLNELLQSCSNLRFELLVRRDSTFKKLLESNMCKIYDNLKNYDSMSSRLMSLSELEHLNKLKKEYNELLNQYEDLLFQYGTDENSGIEGTFRKNIHSLESYLQNQSNLNLYVLILQARRREKDFIMRGRKEYVSQVENIVKKLETEVQKTNLNKNDKELLITLANNYKSSFLQFVQIKNSINITEAKLHKSEFELLEDVKRIYQDESSRIGSFQSSLIPIFFLSLVFSIFLSISISKSITKPVVHLKDATIKVANGELDTKVKIETSDEIGELAKFFNEMTKNIYKSNQIIINQQTTLNKQFMELKEVNATRDKFFSIIAHDLKNPIGAFMSISGYLVKTFYDLSQDEVKEFIDEVNISAKQLHELLENLLLWSRTQRGLINYHPMALDLKSIIKHNTELLKINADAKNIDLILSENVSDISVFADPNMLNTIFRNLITNAVKFTNDNGKIEISYQLLDNNECLITIQDNGIGIEQSKIPNLFKLASNNTTVGTHNETGTGLGLILCKEFVEKNQGKIWVESQIGLGTKFYFTVPLSKAQ